MKKSKIIKYSLLMSIFSLIMCMSMFVGSTFAWFTDQTTSKSNIIKTGKINVSMSWMEGSLTPNVQSGNWKNALSSQVFENANWEPDLAQIRHIKITNTGNLPLEYKLKLDSSGTLGMLEDVIDVYYINQATETNKEDLYTAHKLGTLKDVLENNVQDFSLVTGRLEVGESRKITLALKMQSRVTGDYQNLSTNSNFSLLLQAYQLEDPAFQMVSYPGLETVGSKDTIVTENGIQYLHKQNGEKILYLVPENYKGTSIVVPEGVSAIGSYAFYYNKNIESVTLASTVKEIKANAFRQTSAVKIALNDGLEKIGAKAFKGAQNLAFIEIPSTVQKIEKEAFKACTNLTNVVFSGNPTLPKASMMFSNWDCGISENIVFYAKADLVSTLEGANESSKDYKVKTFTIVSKADELKSAIKDGKHIMLGADIDLGDMQLTIPKGKNIFLNLNGHNITTSYQGGNAYALFQIPENTVLKVGGNGTIKTVAELSKEAKASIFKNEGILNIYSGTFEINHEKSIEDLNVTISVVDDTKSNNAIVHIYGGAFELTGKGLETE